MKQIALLFLASAGIALASESTVEFAFGEVEDFRDFSYSGMSEQKTLGPFERALDREKDRAILRYLKEGETLQITFTDIDMAGDIQPWRNRNNADIRYIYSVYPPSLEFDYVLLNAEGEEIDRGSTRYTDLTFDFNVMSRIRGSDPFFYEMEALESWMRRYAQGNRDTAKK